jgi:acrylyl-CoA reductase (NADPH)
MFQALLLTPENKRTIATLGPIDELLLPAGDVDVRIEYSTLNYKDALAVTGRGAVVRQWPMVPGIDLAGVVEASRDPAWKAGDRVVVTGWGLGETRFGGLAHKARLESGFLLKLPEATSTHDAMVIGTAGFTAALSVMALRKHGVQPGSGEVLVTGAAGGVGSIAVALLAGLGYRVAASTGRPQETDYLKGLGAAEIVDRNVLSAPGKPLQAERWAGVVDTVGSHTLANACAATKWNGAVAACGLAQGADFPSTVMPFILRGITLYGINSVIVPNPIRREAWELMAQHIRADQLIAMTVEIGLSDVIGYCDGLIDGKVRGRTVVDVAR